MIGIHRITIRNFGPITEFSEYIRPLTVFIGPQASGKSTISKLIFYFRSFRDDLLKHLLSHNSQNIKLYEFKKELRKKFVGFFGTTKHMKPFEIKYEYGNNKFCSLSLEKGYVKIDFSNKLSDEINLMFKEIERFKIEAQNSKNILVDAWDIALWSSHKKEISEKVKNAINTTFEDIRTSIFIPAGRSLVATLADQLQDIGLRSTDLLMKEFIDRINLLKINFSKSFIEIIQDRKKFSTERIDFEEINLAISIINRILKGKYVFSSDGEKIYYSDTEYTKLMYSSSGQQEVVWILLLIFIVILEKLDVFMVIEEPEAHLYPLAQKEMVALAALLVNRSQNHLIITTHSPYILSSFNIFLYAANIEEILNEKKSNIVDKRLRIHADKISAYMVDRNDSNFSYESIIDEELGLIKAEAIDDASVEINETIDRLMDLEVGE